MLEDHGSRIHVVETEKTTDHGNRTLWCNQRDVRIDVVLVRNGVDDQVHALRVFLERVLVVHRDHLVRAQTLDGLFLFRPFLRSKYFIG